MRGKSIIGRLIALPLLHKLVAAGIELAFIVAYLVWLASLPPREYTSTTLLFFDRTAVAKLDPGGTRINQRQPIQLAQLILNEKVIQTLCSHFGLFADFRGGEVAQFRSRLALSNESTSSLRISWRGTDRKQTMAITNAMAVLLTSWIPADAMRQRSQPALAEPGPPSTPVVIPKTQTVQDTKVDETEAALRRLRSQLEVISREQQEVRSELEAGDKRRAALGEESRKLEATIAQVNAERQVASNARQPLIEQLAAEKKKLEILRARYTDVYPDVDSAKERISETEWKLAAIPVRPAPDAEQARLTAINSEVKQLGAERSRLLSQSAKADQSASDLHMQESALQATRPEQPSPEPNPLPSKPALSVLPPPPTVQNSPTVGSGDADLVRPFTVLERATDALPMYNSGHQLTWMVVIAGPICGIMYLLWAVWWFRAVRDENTLERIVPGNVAYLGAIPGMNLWRHNV